MIKSITIDGVQYAVTESIFLGTSGGAANDSLRGFGATEQHRNLTLENGWIVTHGDNGTGVTRIVTHDVELVRFQRGRDTHSDIKTANFYTVEPLVIHSVRLRPNLFEVEPQHFHHSMSFDVKGEGDYTKLPIWAGNSPPRRAGSWTLTVPASPFVLQLCSPEDRAAYYAMRAALYPMSKLIALVERIAPRLPTGLLDPQALTKLDAEVAELAVELEAGRIEDTYTELADVAYYAAKAVINNLIPAFTAAGIVAQAEAECGRGLGEAIVLMRVKYEECRIVYGKDKDRERIFVAKQVDRGYSPMTQLE